MKIEIDFLQEKETKGTVRYTEAGDPDTDVIGTLYVKKAHLTEPYPKSIHLTLDTRQD